MVKKFLLPLAAIALSCMAASAQENQVKRLPEVDATQQYREYRTLDRGFFIAAELSGGYSCRISNPNLGYAELDAVAGYRFNEFLQVGAGVGARYYFNNDEVRYTTIKWAAPLFINVRGNIIPHQYRKVVPYYSVDMGGTFRDGFMFRPSVGLRIGQPRSAFLVGLAYMAQGMDTAGWTGEGHRVKYKENSVVSFITLKIGYQF